MNLGVTGFGMPGPGLGAPGFSIIWTSSDGAGATWIGPAGWFKVLIGCWLVMPGADIRGTGTGCGCGLFIEAGGTWLIGGMRIPREGCTLTGCTGTGCVFGRGPPRPGCMVMPPGCAIETGVWCMGCGSDAAPVMTCWICCRRMIAFSSGIFNKNSEIFEVIVVTYLSREGDLSAIVCSNWKT